MKPRITVITLGVDDIERSLAFYGDALGLSTEGIVDREFEHGSRRTPLGDRVESAVDGEGVTPRLPSMLWWPDPRNA